MKQFLKGMFLSKLFGRRMLYGGLLYSAGRMFLNKRRNRVNSGVNNY